MRRMTTTALVTAYYAAFNAHDMPAFLALLTDDVVHDINQGPRQVGKAAFAAFMLKMNRCYREQLTDIVVMQSPDGTRAAAEFVVHRCLRVWLDRGHARRQAPARLGPRSRMLHVNGSVHSRP